jgi:hypothetical protein
MIYGLHCIVFTLQNDFYFLQNRNKLHLEATSHHGHLVVHAAEAVDDLLDVVVDALHGAVQQKAGGRSQHQSSA